MVFLWFPLLLLPFLFYFYIHAYTHNDKHVTLKHIQNLYLNKSDFSGGSDGKASAYNAGDPGLIPGWGRSSGEGNGKPLQYSCLENPMGEAW